MAIAHALCELDPSRALFEPVECWARSRLGRFVGLSAGVSPGWRGQLG